MKKRQIDEFALTDEEIAFLKSDRAHGAARRFTSRQHDTVGIRISAYRKVAAAADAEYRALVAIARLQLARENEAIEATASEPTDTATRVVELTQENRAM